METTILYRVLTSLGLCVRGCCACASARKAHSLLDIPERLPWRWGVGGGCMLKNSQGKGSVLRDFKGVWGLEVQGLRVDGPHSPTQCGLQRPNKPNAMHLSKFRTTLIADPFQCLHWHCTGSKTYEGGSQQKL